MTISHDQIQSYLTQLDQAIYNHDHWYKSLVRTIICRLPHNTADVDPDAHHKCLFGKWYYEEAPHGLKEYLSFEPIEQEHARMHSYAGRLLQRSADGLPIAPHEFDTFENALDSLRLNIFSLKREMLDTLQNTDALTGAMLRTRMLTDLRQQHALVRRGIHPCTLAMIDIDHFKQVNDMYGHQAGDRVLEATVHYLLSNIRPYDILYRYGGEEFLICLPNLGSEEALQIAERLRTGIENQVVDFAGKVLLRITVSVGVAALSTDVPIERAFEMADSAMYAAKSAGRNCSRLWEPGMPLKVEEAVEEAVEAAV